MLIRASFSTALHQTKEIFEQTSAMEIFHKISRNSNALFLFTLLCITNENELLTEMEKIRDYINFVIFTAVVCFFLFNSIFPFNFNISD